MTEIKKISVEQTYPLRKEVLRKGMTLSHEMAGDKDAASFHLGLFDNGQLHCIASFMSSEHPDFKGEHYQLRGMATSEKARGRGYGSLILKAGLNELGKRKANLLWCNAREVALDFYRKLGFKVHGEAFEVPQVGTHYMMYKAVVIN